MNRTLSAKQGQFSHVDACQGRGYPAEQPLHYVDDFSLNCPLQLVFPLYRGRSLCSRGLSNSARLLETTGTEIGLSCQPVPLMYILGIDTPGSSVLYRLGSAPAPRVYGGRLSYDR